MDEQNITLEEWFHKIGADSWSKGVEKYLDKKIIKEVRSVGMDWDEYLHEVNHKAQFKATYVFSFVVLETGHAVGLNENPSTGWTFPIVKYNEEA